MFKKIFCGSLVFVFLGVGTAVADDGAYTSNRFCYALQAMGWCDDYLVRADTEAKLRDEIGADLRGDGSPYDADCSEGLDRYWSEMEQFGEQAACERAWDAVGPMGSELPGILIENPFKS